jgi:hypothetical protein
MAMIGLDWRRYSAIMDTDIDSRKLLNGVKWVSTALQMKLGLALTREIKHVLSERQQFTKLY